MNNTCPPTLLFLCHFLHLRTDIRSLTYLLLSLFFPTHTSSILVSALLLSSLRSKQHRPRWFSPYFVSLSIITANSNADPWCSPNLTLKLAAVSTAHFTVVLLPLYITCTSRTYFSTIPDFLIQYHNS